VQPTLPQTSPALTVSELTEQIRGLLEPAFAEVWVQGEVSNLRRQDSGHCYFSLKDAGAQIPAVLFRQNALRVKLQLRDGMQVVALGRLSVYPPRGGYQLVCSFVTHDGQGLLQQRFEELKRRLEAEGLFDRERKKPLPRVPRCVGFVTSPPGAAVRDFISILRRRGWCGRVVVLPARVQGAGAAEEIADMVRTADASGLFDLLVVGRGGGSLEDLWPFNEEVVVRALAACTLPTISAVGHEIDFTLSDFAADRRAETPSAAAELISSGYVDFCERLRHAARNLERCGRERLHRLRARVELLQSHLRGLTPRHRVEQAHMRLDDLDNRLRAAAAELLRARALRLERLGTRAKAASPEHRLRFARQQVDSLALRLENASPQRVLKRGFALVKDERGQLVSSRKQLRHGNLIITTFADGDVASTVTHRQGELF